MNGDEMTRVIWAEIKRRFIHPYLDVDLKYFDLGLPNRNDTDDQIVYDAAAAIGEYGVGVKCATISPDAERVKEFNLKKRWPSANGIIRNYFGGTVFREPIIIPSIKPYVSRWTKPIVVGRHAYGDQYKGQDFVVPGPGTLELVYTPTGGEPTRIEVFKYEGSGIAQAQPNTDVSIRDFAHVSFKYALSRQLPLYLATKDTVMKKYDGRCRDIFQDIYQAEYESEFKKAGLSYSHRLIDDMVAYMVKSQGGFIVSLKSKSFNSVHALNLPTNGNNRWTLLTLALLLSDYDGDVQSDIVAQGFGSLGLMTSVLTTPDDNAFEAEAAHGTVTRHFREHQKGNPTSTNPIASIFAWTRGLKRRGTIDLTPDVVSFSEDLERACIETVEIDGILTKDLAVVSGRGDSFVHTEEFLDAIERKLKSILA
ncbi:uncharacterized protein JN550_011579 [Neoarthrinium moseri]|uniref:uncharacterized protein n=1 Tax=Neoarthrinium moseri TaxID=1658444 RepID=UPI001FDBC340|nr:uncharacterized protein JN550_011579 [Neoarthrinium moseri]KAI1860313.1 hypothetical protein JN550_011579 [Neoarthrinium moseri]